jgi:hypothetical protein
MVESMRYGTGNNESRGYFNKMLRVAGKRGQEPGSWNGGMWNHGNDRDSRRDAEK